MTAARSDVDWDRLLEGAHPELLNTRQHRSVGDVVLLAVGTLLVVLLASRNLIGGHGTYQVLIDPGVPPGTGLLNSVCANQGTLLDSTNLGTRVLYPSSYVLCDAIRLSLFAHVPAWLIARLLEPAFLWLAAFGGSLVTWQLTDHLDLTRERRISLAIITGLIYALSPFVFDELAASHVYYLAASAAVPFMILLCRTSDRLHPGYPVLACGLLCVLALSQVQYVIFLPVILVMFGLWVGEKARFYGIAALAFAVGLIAELPWALPDVLFPPRVNLSGYFTSSDLASLSVTPGNSVRLLGYPTPFFESATNSFLPLVSAVLVLMFALAAVVWWHLSPRRRAGVGLLVGLSILYMWGGRGAPLYGTWSRAVPWALTGLLRERYSLESVVAAFIVLGVGYACSYLEVRWRWIGIGAAALFLTFGSWAFWNGHLGPYGNHRTAYPDQEKVADLVALNQQSQAGSVLTVPFGSIVKEKGWPTFGRSPFSTGGPAAVLDTEGSASGSTGSLVQNLAEVLNTAKGCATALPILQRLEVRYVVDWKYLTGDTPLDRVRVLNNLASCGFQQVLSDADAIVFVNPSIRAKPITSRYLAIGSEADPANGSIASAWRSGSVEYSSRPPVQSLFPSGSLAHLGRRNITFTPNVGGIGYIEPALLSRSGDLVGGQLGYEMKARGSISSQLTFADGAPLLATGSDPNVSGPVDTVYRGSEVILPLGSAAVGAVGHVQDTRDVSGNTPAVAGISAVAGASDSVTLRAASDEAGLPIPLPLVKPGYYRIHVPVDSSSGPRGSVELVGNGNIVLASVPLSGAGKTVLLAGEVPSDIETLFLYVYQPAGGTTTIGRMDGVASAAVRALAAIDQPTMGAFEAVHRKVLLPAPVAKPTLVQLPAITNAASQVQNIDNWQHYSLARAGIAASVVSSDLGPVLEVKDRVDSAGVPLALSGSPGDRLSVAVQFRGSDGSRVRLRVVSGALEAGSSAWKASDSRWNSIKLSTVILGGEGDPYLYLDVTSRTGHEVTVQFRSVISSLVPATQMLVSDAALTSSRTRGPTPRFRLSDRHWVYLGAAYDPFYQLSSAQVLSRLAPSADGIGNVWLIGSSPSSLSVTYLPETEFKWEVLGVLCLLALALVGLLFLALADLRKRRSSERVLPTAVPEISVLPEDPWGPRIDAPGRIPTYTPSGRPRAPANQRVGS